MSLKKSWGQQQNAIGVTFHSPIVIILTFDTLGLIYSVFVRMNLGALGLPVSGWLCIHSNVYSHLSYAAPVAIYVKLPLKQPHLCSWCCKRTSYAEFHLPCAFFLLLEFPVRCSALKSCWFRCTAWSHSNQPSCTFDLSHSRAGTKWATVCFLFNSMLSAECEVPLSLHPEQHQIALIPQKTHRHALILLNRTLALTCFFRFLSFLYPHVGIEWKETLELIFSNFQFCNFK